MRNIDSTGRRMTMKRLTKDEARRIASRKAWPLRAEPGNQAAQIIDDFLIEPIGSPLVRVLFTKGMICRGFSGRPDEYRIGHALPNAPCERRTDSRKLWAFSFWQHEVGRRRDAYGG